MNSRRSEGDTNQTRSIWLSPRALWFGILGGPCAWFGHLLSAYVIAEFGCVGEADHDRFGEITMVAWMLVAASLVMALAGAIAFLVAYRSYSASDSAADEAAEGSRFTAQAGLAISGLSVLIIVVESVPILYYLEGC